jgi:hypothetical protein
MNKNFMDIPLVDESEIQAAIDNHAISMRLNSIYHCSDSLVGNVLIKEFDILVVDITPTHVFYTFLDDYRPTARLKVYPMLREVWETNSDNRIFVESLDSQSDPEAYITDRQSAS